MNRTSHEIEIVDDGVDIEDVEQAMQLFYTKRPEMERNGMEFSVMQSLMDGLRVRFAMGRQRGLKCISNKKQDKKSRARRTAFKLAWFRVNNGGIKLPVRSSLRRQDRRPYRRAAALRRLHQ